MHRDLERDGISGPARRQPDGAECFGLAELVDPAPQQRQVEGVAQSEAEQPQKREPF